MNIIYEYYFAVFISMWLLSLDGALAYLLKKGERNQEKQKGEQKRVQNTYECWGFQSFYFP